MALGKLSIDLEAKIAGFESDVGRAARVMERDLARSAKASQRALADMQRQAKAVGVMLGTALVGAATGAAYAIKQAINSMDAMSKAAQRAGLPTEAFSKLAYAAGLADVSIEDLQGTLGKLVKNQAEALKSTSEQAKVFQSLGIAVTDSEGKLRSAGDVFADFADAFQRQKGSPEIMAAGFQVMGRSFQNVIPLIKDGSEGLRAAGIEAEELGRVLSTKAGRDAEQFNDNLTRMQSALTGAWQEIAIGMLPKLNSMSGDMVEAAKHTDALRNAGAGLMTMLEGLGKLFGIASRMARQFGVDVATAAQISEGMREISKNMNTYGLADGSIDEGTRKIRDALAQRKKMLDDYRRQDAKAAAEADIERLIANGSGDGGGLPEGWLGNTDTAKIAAAAEAERKRIAAALGDTQSRAKGAKPRKKDMPDFTKEDTEALRQTVQAAADAQDRFEDLAATLAGPLAEAQRQHARQLEEIQRLGIAGGKTVAETNALMEAETRRYEEQQAAIEAQLNPARALIAEMEFENSLLRMGNAEREVAIALRRANVSAMSAEGQQIANLTMLRDKDLKSAQRMDEVQRNLSDAIFDLGKNFRNAESIAKRFFDTIADSILRAAADDWAGKIRGWLSGTGNSGLNESQMYARSISPGGSTGSSGGGFWTTALSFLGSFFGGGRATGGNVLAGKFYEVNENIRRDGPETLSVGGRQFLMMGNQSGTVTPNRGGGFGHEINQTLNFTLAAPTDHRTQQQIATRAGREISSAMRRL